MPTATIERSIDVTLLRALFRNLAAWRVLYEECGVEDIADGDFEFSIHDIEYLASQLHRLSERQHQAIQFMLIDGRREQDVAVSLGLSPTNPVGAYATEGLRKLITWIEDGSLPRFRMGAL